MTDLLRRNLAPITAEAWEQIDETARSIIKAQLTARTLVDFNGPHGWDFAAVNLGRLDVSKSSSKNGVPWGTRAVQPLIELRVPFSLNQMEIDSVSRGCGDPDLGQLEQAARNVALFEETAIYLGFADGNIEGIAPASEHKPLALPTEAREFPAVVGQAVDTLRAAGIDGACALVLGSPGYQTLVYTEGGGYPPHRAVRDIIGGPILCSPALTGGLLLSTRGGDFEMIVGQDMSIGYAAHDKDNVELFLTESFTFRTLEPKAAIELRPAKK